jgi:CHASE3 domain sensor protein
MNLSIDKKLFGGFGALFLAFITLALGAWILSGRLNDRVSELTNVSGRSLQLAGDVQYLAANIKAGQRQVIILSAKQDMNGLKDQARLVETDAQTIVTKLDEINRVSGRSDARASADQARTAMQTWMSNDWRKTRDLAERSQTLEAVEASESGRALLDRAAKIAATIVSEESDRFQENNSQASSSRSSSGTSSTACTRRCAAPRRNSPPGPRWSWQRPARCRARHKACRRARRSRPLRSRRHPPRSSSSR